MVFPNLPWYIVPLERAEIYNNRLAQANIIKNDVCEQIRMIWPPRK